MKLPVFRKIFDKQVKPNVIITFGLMINALGWIAFLMPADIVGGGISGVAALIFFATGFPMGVAYLIINAFLILIAIRVLGASFGIKTIVSVVILSLLFGFFQGAVKEPIVKDDFMATVVGGILAGLGVGIVFTQGSSTGGTDIIAMLVTRYRNISPGRVIFMCDVIIIGSSFFVFRSLEKMVYGYVVMAITAYVIDNILSGSKQSFQLFIFSRNHEQIAERIASDIKRGVTVIDGKGWYSGQQVTILMVLVRKHEINDVFRLIKQADPRAFMSIGEVMGVYGEGFDRIRG
jgi:uncharacterized membrane-anchored protein YitT (DUF2179 family)